MRLTTLTTISPFNAEFQEHTKGRNGVRGRKFADYVHLEVKRINSTEYRIFYIRVDTLQRMQGYGSEAMTWLCELADAHNIKLSLCPAKDTDDPGMNTIALTRWYQTFGFVRIGMQDEMMRYPNATKL